MNSKTITKSLFALSAVVALAACSNQTTSNSPTSTSNSKSELKTVKVASVGSDAEIWRHIAETDQAKKAGLKIEVEELNGGVPLNQAVAEGSVDANAFQSIGYLQGFNESNSSKLTPIGTTYIEPMGLYSKKVKALNDLPNGAKIAIPDNPYNTTRALRLLETAGLIKLSTDFKEGTGTPSDIVENKKNFEFLLIDDTTSVRVLDDADLIAIGNTIALEGGLNELGHAKFQLYRPIIFEPYCADCPPSDCCIHLCGARWGAGCPIPTSAGNDWGSLSAALHHSLTTVASDNPDLFGGFHYFTGNCHGGTGSLCCGVTCSNQYRRICLGG